MSFSKDALVRDRIARRCLASRVLAGVLSVALGMTMSGCKPRDASVRFLVKVQVSDAYGTYSHIGIWQSRLHRPFPHFAPGYGAKLIASPIIITLPHSGVLTVYPTSQVNASDAPFQIPEQLFRQFVQPHQTDPMEVLITISRHAGASARMNCQYDKVPAIEESTQVILDAMICPAVSFQSTTNGVGQILPTGVSKEVMEISKSIKIDIKILGQ